MKKKICAGLVIIFLCMVSVEIGRRYFAPRVTFSLEKRAFLRSQGEPGSPLWIVEYFDYQCGPCRHSMDVIKTFINKKSSKIYFQARFFPLSNHLYAMKAARYAECAARQGKFWKLHDLLFARQNEWTNMPVDKIDKLFRSYAIIAGVDPHHLDICLKNPEIEKTILDERGVAKSMGVSSTPTFFVNGQMIVGIDAFEEYLKVLAKKDR